MKSYTYLLLFLLLLGIISCGNKNKEGNSFEFPENVELLQQSSQFDSADYLIIVYFNYDSLNIRIPWGVLDPDYIKNEHPDTNFVFYLSGSNKESINNIIQETKKDVTVFHDPAQSFYKRNKLDTASGNPDFHAFIVKNRKVLSPASIGILPRLNKEISNLKIKQ